MSARGAPAAAASGPLSGVDLDESPGALPVADQLSIALSTNAACIIDLFAELDQDQNGTIAFGEFDEGLRMLGLAVPTLYIKLLFKAWDREYARPAVHILPLALVCMLHSRLLALSPPSLSPLSPLSLLPLYRLSLLSLSPLSLSHTHTRTCARSSLSDASGSGTLSLQELATILDDESTRKPLANLDLDEGPNAPPINQQLKDALASNAVKVIDLFKSWDDNGDGLIARKEFEQGLRALGLDVPTSIINDLFYSWDSDSSGELSMREVGRRRFTCEDAKHPPFLSFPCASCALYLLCSLLLPPLLPSPSASPSLAAARSARAGAAHG